jgi:hypothetical protein
MSMEFPERREARECKNELSVMVEKCKWDSVESPRGLYRGGRNRSLKSRNGNKIHTISGPS